MNKIRLVFILLLPISTLAAEPGHLHNENPPPHTAQAKMDLRQAFAKAKGLSENQLKELHYNRIACARRIYSPAGWSVDGDADLKIVEVTSNLFEAEFPSHLNLASFDPYQADLDQIETVTSRQLVNFGGWTDGQSMKLFKTVSLSYMDPNTPKATGYVTDEFKIIEDTYPPTFIVKETISVGKNLIFYFVCQ
jgi:hypothetical protein